MKTASRQQPAKPSPLERKWQKWWLGLDEAEREALGPALGFEDAAPTPKQLVRLEKRKHLELYEAGLSDLKPLSVFVNLTTLDLYGNGFSDLKPLAKLTKLRALRIGNCTELTDLAPLAKLTNLVDLDISSTSISKLAPLGKLAKLRFLLMEGLDHIDDLDEQIEALEAKLPKLRISLAD